VLDQRTFSSDIKKAGLRDRFVLTFFSLTRYEAQTRGPETEVNQNQMYANCCMCM
jgi:hypothetical protein